MKNQLHIGVFQQALQRRIGLHMALGHQHQQAQTGRLYAGRNGVAGLNGQGLFLKLQAQLLLVQALGGDRQIHQQHGVATVLRELLQHLGGDLAQVVPGDAGP